MTRLDAVRTLRRLEHRKGNRVHEAHVSAESTPPEQDTRIPRADEDEGWPESAQAAAGQGAQTAVRLTGRFPRTERLTNSAEIQALFQQGKRVDRPAVVILWRETSETRRAGFAVTRQIRDAVRRNRVRRRLREAYRLARAAAPPQVALVIIGKRRALDAPFAELAGEIESALATIGAGRR